MRFDMWKMKMEDLLCDQELWSAIEKERPVAAQPGIVIGKEAVKEGDTTSEQADPKEIEDWDRIDRRAKGLIRLCLAD